MSDTPLHPRYELKAALGQGGMGTVYRAWDRLEGREVAVKRISGRNGLDSLDRLRFDRESRILSLLQHEQIVRLLGMERFQGAKSYSMELLGGKPLNELLEAEGLLNGERIEWLVRTVAKLLGAIEYLHKAGYVHHDLKPANVIVLASRSGSGETSTSASPSFETLLADPDPEVKLIDFGLAAGLGETRDPEQAEAGTALYVAPERMAPGARQDPRSDLYSVGVLLYQLITREFPFPSLARALSSRRRRPRAPAEINHHCPKALSNVICRQLEREPHRRAQSAAELRQSLLGALDPSATYRPRLHSAAFVGRGTELGVIEEALTSASLGNGRSILLTGPTGSGKTWLLERSGIKARAVLDHGMVYFEGSYERGGSVHQGMRAIFEGMLLELEADIGVGPIVEGLGPWGGHLARAFLPDTGENSTLEELGRALEQDLHESDLQRDHVVEAARRLFMLRASRGPMLLVLDDLQYAEELDLAILRRLISVAVDQPICVVASYRAASAGTFPLLERWLGELEETDETRERVQSLRLDGLPDSDVERVLRGMLDAVASPAPALVRHVIEETRGSPRQVADTLRELWSSGRVRHRGKKWELLTSDIPESMDEKAAEEFRLRAEASSPEVLAVLQAASIIGERFDLGSVSSLLSSTDEEARLSTEAIQTALLEATRAGFLEPSREAYRFSAPSIWRQSRELSDADTRKRYHRLLARTLLEDERAPAEETWVNVAEHFEAAGDLSNAARHYLKFARHAESLGAYQRSLRSYQKALALSTEPGERSSILESLGQLFGRLGDLDRALDCFKQSQSGREEGPDLIPILLERGRLLRRRGEFNAALEIFKRSEKLAAGNQDALARVLYQLACVRVDRGELPTAIDSFQHCLRVYREIDDPIGMFTALLGLGLVEKRRGELDVSIERIEEAMVCAERAGRPDQIAAALHNLANVHRARSDTTRAIACLRRSVEIRETLGDRQGLAICQNNLSRCFAQRGEIPKATEAAEEALEIFKEVGDQRGIVVSLSNLGSFKFYEGALGAAERIFESHLELARRLRSPEFVADALYSLGILENARGDPRAAEERLSEGVRALPDAGYSDQRARFCAELARARIRLGNREGSRDALEEGWSLVHETGSSDLAGLLHETESDYHLMIEDTEAAEVAARKAVDSLDRSDWKFEAATAHRQLACVYREIGPDWVDQAEKHFEVARKTFEEMGSVFELGRTRYEEARMWTLLEEFEEAAGCFHESIEVFRNCGAPRRVDSAEKALKEIEGQ